jgi:hypothetical protein
VILSIIAILGAAAAALLVDYLRSRNEQLRASMVEMKVRREVERRQAALQAQFAPQLMSKSAMAVPTGVPSASADESGKIAPEPPQPSASPPPENVTKETGAIQETAAADDRIRFRRQRRPTSAASAALEKEETMPKKALSEWLIQRAVARAAEKAHAEMNETPQADTAPSAEAPAEADTARGEPAESAGPRSGTCTVVIDESLLASLASADASPAVVSKSDALRLPTGMHNTATLKRLEKELSEFTGLIVSIGITHADAESRKADESMSSIVQFVEGLMEDMDFGCRVKADEMLLICPGHTGLAAQRRLSLLSEQLWDYQLRQLDHASVAFSLGGIDVHAEPLSEAIILANERMVQTRRNRRAVMLPPPGRRVKVI